MKKELRKADPLTRRHFAETCAHGALGLSILSGLEPLMGAKPGKAKHVIYVFMAGGMTHIDTLDPKPGTRNQGQTKVIDTAVPGIQFGEYLPNLADRAKDLAVIRSLTQKTGSHEGGSYWMQTGFAQSATVRHPNVGALSQMALGKQAGKLPDTIYIGGPNSPGPGFLGPKYAPLPVIDPMRGLPAAKAPVEGSRLKNRLDALEGMNKPFLKQYETQNVKDYMEFYDNALSLIDGKETEVFDLTKESRDVRGNYGETQLGQGLLLARRLIESGVRFVRVQKSGWDMHQNLWQRLPAAAADLDMALSALIDDLQSRGLFDETLIVLATEFGRTPVGNGSGRDHHPLCFSGLMAGGGIAGGQVHGQTDANGYSVEEDPCTPADLNATITGALGISPETRFHLPSGRPFFIGADGKPLTHLFG